MAIEAALLLVGTFLVLAIGFWTAAHRSPGEGRERGARQELHRA
jgi:hypothetical protein